MHFQAARDAQRAAVYLQQAAESARRRSAYREARLHDERALALLGQQPAGHERTERARKLALRIGLGSVMVAAQGWGAPEVDKNAHVFGARDLVPRAG